jgi:hypothetical protein
MIVARCFMGILSIAIGYGGQVLAVAANSDADAIRYSPRKSWEMRPASAAAWY